MASSLASQLAGIRSLNASRLASSASLSSSASYLFPPRTAAAQDLDTVYSLAQTGWAELCLDDLQFEKWGNGNTLFGPQVRATDRTLLGKEENAKLNEAVEEFLDLAGPVLLNKSTAKCLEWLVRRFRVHEFNTMAVLRAFMPYHQTPQFARMLHILDISANSFLSFLQPLKKTTQPLPTSVLLSAMLAPATSSTSLDLLRFVISTISSKKPHRAQILFWSSTLVQFCARFAGVEAGAEVSTSLAKSASKSRKNKASLETRRDNAQLTLAAVLPAAVAAVKDTWAGKEVRLAGCLVLCAIGATAELSEEAIAGSVEEISTSLTEATCKDARFVNAVLRAAASLCSNAPPASTTELVPTTAAERFLNIPNLDTAISTLNRSYDVQPFLQALLRALASIASDERARSVLSNLVGVALEQGGIADETLQTLVRDSLSAPEAQLDALLPVLAACRQRRPHTWNAAVAGMTAACQDDVKQRETLGEVIKKVTRAGAGVGATSAAAESNAAWLDINAAEASHRALALESMLASIKAGDLSPNKDEFVKSALLARLSDDDEQVLAILYSQGAVSAWLDAMPSSSEILASIEVALTLTPTSPVSTRVLRLHLDFVLGPFLAAHPKAGTRVLRNVLWPRLLLTHSQAAEAAETHKAIQEASLDNAVLSLLQSVTQQSDDVDAPARNALVAAGLAQGFAQAASFEEWNAHLSFLVGQISDSARATAQVTPAAKALALLTLSHVFVKLPESRFVLASKRILKVLEPQVKNRSHAAVLAQSFEVKPSHDVLQHVYDQTSRSTAVLSGQVLVSMAHALNLRPTTSAADSLVGLCDADAASPEYLGVARTLYEWSTVSSSGGLTGTLGRSILATLFGRMGESAATFLAGIWTPALAAEDGEDLAAAALRHMRAFFTAYVQDPALKATDFQVLLPALLLGLSHGAAPVRREALACLRVVADLAKEGSSRPDAVRIWGFDAVYGKSASESLKYLDCAQTYHFCFEVLEHAESLANDASYATALLGGLLTPSKGNEKKVISFKRSVTSFLASHVVSWPSPIGRLQLLRLLSRVRDAVKLQALLKLAEGAVSAGSSNGSAESSSAAAGASGLSAAQQDEYLALLFDAFDRRSKALIEDRKSGAWNVLVRAFTSTKTAKHASAALKALFSTLPQDMRKEAVESLARFLADPEQRAPQEVRQTLASLEVDASILVVVFAQLRETLSNSTTTTMDGAGTPAAKKAKTDAAPKQHGDSGVATATSVLSELLEAALGRKLPPQGALLVELFETLRCVVDLHSSRALGGGSGGANGGSGGGSGDYLMHLCMSNLNKLLEPATPTTDVVQSLRVDTVINVVKASTNPATFQQALLLLSSIAALAPETVLHSAMPIFTFVGSTVLQRDDAFSFTVVERVLRSIVPPLVKSLVARSSSAQDGTQTDADAAASTNFELLKASRSFLCIFTDSATHIPRHRRQVFFQLLIDVLGPERYAAAVTMLLVDRSAHKITRQQQQQRQQQSSSSSSSFEGSEASPSLHLPLAVLGAQPATTQLRALNETWAEARRLWASREAEGSDQNVFLDRLARSSMGTEHSERHVDARTQVLALLTFIRAAVASRSFVVKLSRGGDSEDARSAAYHAFIENALSLADDGDDAAIAGLARSSLAGIMDLVPVSTFMAIVQRLLGAADSDGKLLQSGLALASTRIPELTAAQRDEAARWTPSIIDVAQRHLAGGECAPVALLALQALSASALPAEHHAFSAALPAILDADANANAKDRQVAFSIVRNLSGSLGPRLIAHLKRIVALCLGAASSFRTTPTSIVVRALDTLARLFAAVPAFMEAHVQPIVELISGSGPQSPLQGGSGSGSGAGAAAVQARTAAPLRQAANALLSAMLKRVPSEKVFASVFEAWKKLSSDCDLEAQLGVLAFLQRALRSVDRSAISANYKAVFRFVLQVLDTRRLAQGSSLSDTDIDALEDSAVRVFVRLVLKLNETTFRPLFLRIYDWAALDLASSPTTGEDLPPSDGALVARRIALFKVSNALSESLRGLVSHYYGTLLDLAVALLEAFRRGEVADARLWAVLLRSVALSAQHDHGTFWNPARLAKLAPPLVGQLALLRAPTGARAGAGPTATATATATATIPAPALLSALTPAILHLAQTVRDESSLKVLNSALLSSLRSPSARVRAAALRLLTALWSASELQTVLLGLVPETVPHVAEIMEGGGGAGVEEEEEEEGDEGEQGDGEGEGVEEGTRTLVAAIEVVLGEPLDAYLQ